MILVKYYLFKNINFWVVFPEHGNHPQVTPLPPKLFSPRLRLRRSTEESTETGGFCLRIWLYSHFLMQDTSLHAEN